jgi:FkbM family methyltransferase
MRKIFLDCGTNLCQGLSQIIKIHNMDNSWNIYSFEVNPITFNQIDKSLFPNVNFINKGVWSEDCTRKLTTEVWPGLIPNGHNEFLINKDICDAPIGGASHVLSEDWVKPEYIPECCVDKDVIDVECIDLTKFIETNFEKSDLIIVKLDCEGAEYCILEKMISNGVIDFIDEFYIEWHSRLMSQKFDENKIREVINQKNIKLNNWY